MIVIPAGKFIADKTISQDEVTIPKGFAVSRYAVTFDEWDAAVAAGGVKHNPKDEGWGRGRRPVINISFDDARAYVAWLSATTASHYRLLFQSEWEYVCRGGTTGAFGDVIREDQANFISDRTKKVGSYAANVFGVYDMHGNVDEWCNDGWDFRTIEPATVPARGFRGGSWRDESKTHWSVFTIGPNGRYNHVGLRVARTTCG